MPEVKIAIYKTPSQAKKIGTNLVETRYITKNDAIKLRDYCYDVEAKRITTMGLISLSSPILGKLLTASIATLIGTVTGGAGLIESYFKQTGDKVLSLVDTMADNQKVTFTYTYKRSGSNDGAYWLTNIK